MRLVFLFNVLALFSLESSGCLNTYQFRIFPIGHYNGEIVTIDYKVCRTSQIEGARKVEFELDQSAEMDIMWILVGNISHYDAHQNLLHTTTFDTTFSLESTYIEELNTSFQKGLDEIKRQKTDLSFFTPQRIRFFGYREKGRVARVKEDTIQGKSLFEYKNNEFEISVIKNESFFGFNNSPYYSESIGHMGINSLRIYKADDFQLIIFHAGIGMRLSSFKAKNEAGDFDTLQYTTFFEPVMHHGYGVDFFVLKE